ncbi:MAG: hypothetical protein HYV09_27830, partial [Deltaproteobacteria bacterium]|nr:hypothetical protein [Deltaproteobacteria bacterium]
MHRVTRPFNVPLALALFGGAVLVGGAILAYPDTRRAPSKTDVGDPIGTRPFPSYPDELPTVVGAQPPTPMQPISPRPPLPAPNMGGGPEAEEPPAPQSSGTMRAPPAPG